MQLLADGGTARIEAVCVGGGGRGTVLHTLNTPFHTPEHSKLVDK